MRIFVSAGEASGDALGASLIEAIRERTSKIEVYGMGGPRMAAAGVELVRDSKEASVMGLAEVLVHLPRLFALLDALAWTAVARAPDVAVLIDLPDFHVRLAKKLRKAGIPVVLYVGPSVWAWREGRVRQFQKVLDRLLVLFPFELPPWQRAGVDVVHVGHPLADEIDATEKEVDSKLVALLPGSRRGEVKRHFSIMLQGARRMVEEGLAERFVVPVAPTLDPAWLATFIEAAGLSDRVRLVEDTGGAGRRAAVAQAKLAWVVSGTATLETALLAVPQVIFYRVSWLSYWLGKWLMKVPWFGLPNLLLNRGAVPELLQGAFSVDAVLRESKLLLARPDGTARQQAQEIRARLGDGGAAGRAAEAVLSLASQRRLTG